MAPVQALQYSGLSTVTPWSSPSRPPSLASAGSELGHWPLGGCPQGAAAVGPLEDARAGELDAPQGPAPHEVRCTAGPKGWGARAARSRVSELACQKGGELACQKGGELVRGVS